jgi:phosphate transport system protein
MVKFIEIERSQIKEDVNDMFALVIKQIEQASTALLSMDKGIASQVIVFEHKVNSFELKITKEIEDYIALYNPVAIDLRFMLSLLQMTMDLERIGDYARSMARFVKETEMKELNPELVEKTQLKKMIQQVLAMLKTMQVAFTEENAELAHTIFDKDDLIDHIRTLSTDILRLYGEQIPDTSAKICLQLQDVFRKLERTGDHITNMAEEFIFYLDAKVLKHQKKR